MLVSTSKEGPASPAPTGTAPATESRALESLWQLLHDIPNPNILDCGPACQPTLDVLLRRGAKLYVVDLVSPAQRDEPALWDSSGKRPVFRTDHFLAQVPPIPPGSLSAAICWHLFDLVPRDTVPPLVDRLWSYLRPGGALFCLLREPYLATGARTSWWFESLTVLGTSEQGNAPFPYPALTNREMERLVPGGTVKTFLTRAGRREVLAIK